VLRWVNNLTEGDNMNFFNVTVVKLLDNGGTSHLRTEECLTKEAVVELEEKFFSIYGESVEIWVEEIRD
jgi:hypothetical protein